MADKVAHVARTLEGGEEFNTLVLADVDYEVWVRAFDHWVETPLRNMPYILEGPLPSRDLVRSGNTDPKGDLRERYLPWGEYNLRIAGGEAVVAARCQEIIDADDGGRGKESLTWPDAVRTRNAEVTGEEVYASDTDEPGASLPDEILDKEALSWIESNSTDANIGEIGANGGDEDAHFDFDDDPDDDPQEDLEEASEMIDSKRDSD